MMNLQLGRSRRSMHQAPMKFKTYLDDIKLPPLVTHTSWATAVTVPWGMDLNDTLGDCTCAGPAHNVIAITSNAGSVVVPTDADVLTMYKASGYNGTPATDQGWTLDAAESWMVKNGLAGVQADGYVDIDHTNMKHIKYALQLLGPGLNFGVNLPQSAMDLFESCNGVNVVWSVANMKDTTIIGGHDVACIDFTVDGNFRIVTWGSDGVVITPDWLLAYCDEVSAMYFKAFCNANGIAPNGLNLVQMETDAKDLAS